MHGSADRSRAGDGSRWALEDSQEAIAGGVDLVTAEAPKLLADETVMLLPQIPPRDVTEFGSALGRADDVGEEDRGE
jgi:hypothetical protein